MIMREIKFRGQRTDNKEWVYGNLINWHEKLHPRIIWFKIEGESLSESEQIETNFEVAKESVGQYTGLKDKNGVEIYDGDIVRILYTDWSSKSEDDPRTLEQFLIDISKIGVVEFNDNSWEVKMYSKKYDDYSHSSISCGIHGYIEVIGNIHENPELLCTSQST